MSITDYQTNFNISIHTKMENNKLIAILEMLLLTGAAAYIGYLISSFFSKGKVADLEAQIAAKQKELADCRKSKVELPPPAAAMVAAAGGAGLAGVSALVASAAAVADDKFDDLKVVEGIGPKIEQLLYAAGIKTWKKLSETSPEAIRAILDAGGPQFKSWNPGTWPAQSKLADEAKWEQLKKWQDELHAGR